MANRTASSLIAVSLITEIKLTVLKPGWLCWCWRLGGIGLFSNINYIFIFHVYYTKTVITTFALVKEERLIKREEDVFLKPFIYE